MERACVHFYGYILTSSIPTDTDAGTYYVWYKAVGDEGYTDSDVACVTVKIAEKESEQQPQTEPSDGSTDIEFNSSSESLSESEGEAPASAQGEGLDALLTEEDKAAGATYNMTIQPKSFESVRANGGEQIQQKAKEHYATVNTEGAAVKEVYLDMSIFKTMGGATTEIHSTGSNVIHVWFPYNLKGRSHPMFWRYHDGAARTQAIRARQPYSFLPWRQRDCFSQEKGEQKDNAAKLLRKTK